MLGLIVTSAPEPPSEPCRNACELAGIYEDITRIHSDTLSPNPFVEDGLRHFRRISKVLGHVRLKRPRIYVTVATERNRT